MSDEANLNPVELATEITIAWLNNPNNRVSAEEVPSFLKTIHTTVRELANGFTVGIPEDAPTNEFTPAVSVRRSLGSKDYILSLIDGKPYKTLTRHLSTNGLTPAQYRERYGLKADYPMVAENYAAHRRELAKRIGLGRRPKAPVAQVEPIATPAPESKPAPVEAKAAGNRPGGVKAASNKTVAKKPTAKTRAPKVAIPEVE